MLREAELFKEMLPEKKKKKEQFPFICIEECLLYTLISWIMYPGLIINQNKLLYSDCNLQFQELFWLFFSESSSDFSCERITLPVGCINILIFHVFSYSFISQLGIGKTSVDRFDMFMKI